MLQLTCTHKNIIVFFTVRTAESFTDELLSGAESVDLRHVRKEIRKIDTE